MSTAQWLYIAFTLVYTGLFLFFTRILYLRHYANRHYYGKRPPRLSLQHLARLAASRGRDLPYFSIFIPARNEADVIARTIDHMGRLHYSPDHYEILVVTDEKEAMAARKTRAAIADRLIRLLTDGGEWDGTEQEEATLLALLARLALDEADLDALHPLTLQEQAACLFETARALLCARGKADPRQIRQILRRTAPRLQERQIDRLCPALLALALPVIELLLRLQRKDGSALVHQLLACATGAQQPLTQEVLANLTYTLEQRMAELLCHASAAELRRRLADAFRIALPTTQEIVERKRLEFAAHRNLPALRHVQVPYDFDGRLGGECTGHEVPSTKGRALNWAFPFADPRSEMWAFYDAESRPDPDVLRYVAWRRLTAGDQFQIAQGPVYQIRNFWQTGPISKVAGIFQAIAHEWMMPWQLREIPFIGGTNIFATRELILRIGGFDPAVLTEDMDLGARAWLQGDTWPEFLPYASSEQTPPTYRGFFRQRLRWGSGYLQVCEKIKADSTAPAEKRHYLLRIYWWRGPVAWTLCQLLALLPLVAMALGLTGHLDARAVPDWVHTVLSSYSVFYLAFALFCLLHYRRFMDPAPRKIQTTGFAQIFLLPISAFFLPLPYSASLLLKLLHRAPTTWVKTPRTRE